MRIKKVDPKIKKFININADRAGISYEEADKIWECLGRMVKKVISEGEILEGADTFKSIYIKDLGIIYPNRKQIYKVREILLNKQQDENIQSEGQ